jgi:hypothetical protein
MGTAHFIATDFNPLRLNEKRIKSSIGTTHFVATDFNPLTLNENELKVPSERHIL